MPSVDSKEDVRFIEPCNRCGQVLREFLKKVVTHEHTTAWIPEHHELPDCIRHLNERLLNLEATCIVTS